MKRQKISSDLKAMAKEQLLGNYGIAAGTFAILYGIIIGVVILVYLAVALTILTGGNVSQASDLEAIALSPGYYIMMLFVTALLGALFSTLFVGYANIALKIARGDKPKIADLFYCYSHHPDKVIILYLMLYAVNFVLMLPAQITAFFMEGTEAASGVQFLIWAVLYTAGLVLSVIFSLMVSQVYFLYVDDSMENTIDIFKQSIRIMKKNKGRLFYIMLSFLGWYLLILASCGIAAFWIIPYQAVTLADFYRDLAGEFNENADEN
ncbi:MAG TPA: DUF975 family protein [Lachnospiraceae bacterium]|nr:DUF975 family protein [Lachnospiraceae bacterium]